MKDQARAEVVGVVDYHGYLFCSKCAASRGVYGGIPVCRDSHPHAFEKCDSCLTVCNERGQS